MWLCVSSSQRRAHARGCSESRGNLHPTVQTKTTRLLARRGLRAHTPFCPLRSNRTLQPPTLPHPNFVIDAYTHAVGAENQQPKSSAHTKREVSRHSESIISLMFRSMSVRPTDYTYRSGGICIKDRNVVVRLISSTGPSFSPALQYSKHSVSISYLSVPTHVHRPYCVNSPLLGRQKR